METIPQGGAQPELQRRLATILAADVAGYSRMMGENEERTVATLRGHRAVFDALLKQHHGRVFNTAGDAILAEFPSTVEAVRCATEIQSALQTRNEHLPPGQKMLFRMGINVGDVVVQEGDLLGDGVNVAARIQSIAEPGGICISGSVYDQIRNKLSLHFSPLGDRNFKNIAQPIRTFAIAHGEDAAFPVASRRPAGKSVRTITVGAIVAAALAAGGYWIYRDNEARRVEQEAMTVRLAAEKRAAEEARRAAEEQGWRAAVAERKAEGERLAAEAAKREAALRAQAQAAEEGRRRAEAERKRLEDERRRSEAEKKTATAPASPLTPGGRAARDQRFDGIWAGTFSCGSHGPQLTKEDRFRFNPAPFSVPVTLSVKDDEATARREDKAILDEWRGWVSGGRLTLQGRGHWKDEVTRAWLTVFSGTFSGNSFEGKGALKSLDGSVTFRECTLKLARQ